MKFDPPTSSSGNSGNLLAECLFLKKNSMHMSRVPKYKEHATVNVRRFLVMQLLEKSLDEHIKAEVGRGKREDEVLVDVA